MGLCCHRVQRLQGTLGYYPNPVYTCHGHGVFGGKALEQINCYVQTSPASFWLTTPRSVPLGTTRSPELHVPGQV